MDVSPCKAAIQTFHAFYIHSSFLRYLLILVSGKNKFDF